MKLPTLYKKTASGAIQFWSISTMIERGGPSAMIITDYGQHGTDSPQQTTDIIRSGKNGGKKNETSAKEQSEIEAQAKWSRQLKRGYVTTVEAAEAGELDKVIEGGIVPMLAHSFDKHGHKILYPAYIQPKLDGIRAICVVKDGKATLWSRTRKPVTGVPHIIKAVEKLAKRYPGKDFTLDGELYNHDHKANFERIVSLVRQEVAAPGHEEVEYHIYDLPSSNAPFSVRTMEIGAMELDLPLSRVTTLPIHNESEISDHFTICEGMGYEGVMVRNANSLYVNKRSYDLLKVKEFMDDEFRIVGVEEGRGKLKGHVGAFVCLTNDGEKFMAKMSGSTERLRAYYIDNTTWLGKLLTVQYQGLTGANKLPRFPVGLRIRQPE